MRGANRPQVTGATAARPTAGVYETRSQSWCQPAAGRIVSRAIGGFTMREGRATSSSPRPTGFRPGGRTAAAAFAVLALLPTGAPAASPLHTPRRHLEAAAAAVSAADAVRFLEQATLGPTAALIAQVQQVGFAGYLDEQFDAATSSYPNLAPMPADSKLGCPVGSAATCYRDNYTMYPLQVRFFKNALDNDDQLRQRVALALHEILVVSGEKVQQPSQMAPYLDLLLADAFANYRTILYDVTLNPAMGHYLDMVNNDAPAPPSNIAPNENYAREVMQLFSIGVNMLNPDGSLVLDGGGNPVPTYTQDTIEDFAHVFTGWTYAPLPGVPGVKHDPPNFLAPMWLYRNAAGFDANHDHGEKLLLSYPGSVHSTLPPGQDGNTDLTQALDNIFYHPNVGPFIGKQLIQHLVTSNPSPDYVRRVAQAFDDNGSGVRGDMRAVITAILLDPEARGDVKTDPAYGRLREPVLFITNVCRAVGATSDGILAGQANAMGQNLFNSSSVFSYYPHEYEVPGTPLQGPEFGIQSSLAASSRVNFVNALAFSRINSPAPDPGTAADFSALAELAGDPSGLVAALDRLYLHDTMSNPAVTAVVGAVAAIPPANALLRVQTAFYLVASSSQYQVAR